MFVFKLLEQPTENSKLDLEKEYIGDYQNNEVTKDIVVKITGTTENSFEQAIIVPMYKVEKLYQWK